MDSQVRERNRRFFREINGRLAGQGRPPLSAVFITNREDGGRDRTFYLITGIYHGTFTYSSAVVFPNGEVRLVVSELEKEEARRARLPYLFVTVRPEFLKKLLGRRKRVGIHGKYLCHEMASTLGCLGYTLVDVSQEIRGLKLQKTSCEMENMKEACDVAVAVAGGIPEWVHGGMCEVELAARINFEMALRGALESAFNTIVAFGENSGVPHHKTGRRRLKRGDLVLVDFGARIGQMNSDLTRVFVFGRASDRQRQLYEYVRLLQSQALGRLRAGVDGSVVSREIVELAGDFCRKNRFKGSMNHGLGHSIGVDVHDGFSLGQRGECCLPVGLVTSVEPGIYCPGWGGIRIEDDVVIRSGGVLNLTWRRGAQELVVIS